MRPFQLEVFLSKWEFEAAHHMTASDIESTTVAELLTYASDAQREAFEQLHLGYTDTWGARDLREEIARTYDKIDADHVLCLAGAGEGLYALARVLLQPGDHAIVPTPNYQSAETVPLEVCEVSGVALRRDQSAPGGWRLDLDELRDAIEPETRLISLNLPHNPTGHLLTHDELDAVIEMCRKRKIWLLCDEVYRGVELDADARLPQIADRYERGISLNVMSKAYGLPGLRIGWFACQNRQLLEHLERYKHYLSICNSAPAERLALFALQGREQILAHNRALLAHNLDQLEALLADFPGLIEWQRPRGGCVAFPRYAGPGDGETFCRELLEQRGVLFLPSSIYASELTDVPPDHFRIGFGRGKTFESGLQAMREHFTERYAKFAR
jgi:aspartate/methionine/tyrosine aminotransferase